MFINNFDPVAIQIFSLEIKWYSLAYIAGILLGWILSKKIFISNEDLRDKFDDFITYFNNSRLKERQIVIFKVKIFNTEFFNTFFHFIDYIDRRSRNEF